jgi:hypothetical protein
MRSLGQELGKAKLSVLAILCLFTIGTAAASAQHESPSYRIEESFIGPGGLLDAASSNYTLRASLGDTGVGNSASASYQIYGGYTTTDAEYLEVFVPNSIIDLGVLTEFDTATGSGQFYIRSYLSHGYAVTTTSEPPTNGAGEQIDALAARAAPTPGQEEFGINLVSNSNPENFGANPNQIPDNSFSFGYANIDYDVPDEFKYSLGDIVAKADSSSGVTEYTVSYIMNISGALTTAGQYVMDHDLVVTPTF